MYYFVKAAFKASSHCNLTLPRGSIPDTTALAIVAVLLLLKKQEAAMQNNTKHASQ